MCEQPTTTYNPLPPTLKPVPALQPITQLQPNFNSQLDFNQKYDLKLDPWTNKTHPNYPQNNPPLPLATKRPTTTTTVIAKLPNNPKPMKPERQPLPTQLSISTATTGLCYHHSQPSHS